MGPQNQCLDTSKKKPSVGSKMKSRPALLNRAKPFACTLERVCVCHKRPWGLMKGPGRAGFGSATIVIMLL